MQNSNWRKNIIALLALFIFGYEIQAADSLRIAPKRKFLAVKTNLAFVLFRGVSVQAECIVNKHLGTWTEGSMHSEEQSMLDVPLREINFVTGVNYYGFFKKGDTTKIHNGPYIGTYIKCKQGYYGADKVTGYKAFFLGVQAGIQTVSSKNIIFNMGIGYGIGYFSERKELIYSTFYEKYNLPLMDFRANISLGYMF